MFFLNGQNKLNRFTTKIVSSGMKQQVLFLKLTCNPEILDHVQTQKIGTFKPMTCEGSIVVCRWYINSNLGSVHVFTNPAGRLFFELSNYPILKISTNKNVVPSLQHGQVARIKLTKALLFDSLNCRNLRSQRFYFRTTSWYPRRLGRGPAMKFRRYPIFAWQPSCGKQEISDQSQSQSENKPTNLNSPWQSRLHDWSRTRLHDAAHKTNGAPLSRRDGNMGSD
jgi:hypothetical protein